MDNNSFSLRGLSARRASTAVPVERPWNPPPRRLFSSREQQTNRANAEALTDFVDRIDEPPSYLRDDSKMHRPFSNPRFGALRIASQEGPDIEMDDQGSIDHSQADGKDSLEADLTDASGSQEKGDGQGLSRDDPLSSFSDAQDLIDSLWDLNRIPEQLQERFDAMKEEIHNRATEFAAEKRTNARLSQDTQALRREVKAWQEKEKQYEQQFSKQKEAIDAELSKTAWLQEENEKLQLELRRDQKSFKTARTSMKRELDQLSENLQIKERAHDQIQSELVRAKQRNEDEVKRRDNAEAECKVIKRDLIELRKTSNEEKRKWMTSHEEDEARIAELGDLNNTLTAKTKSLEDAVENKVEEVQVLEADLLGVLSFLRSVCNVIQQVYQVICVHSHRGLPDMITLPRSIGLMADEECGQYEVFGQLCDALNTSPSATSVLELAGPYKEAMTGFFKTLALRDVAQSHFVSSSDDALKSIKHTHEQLRHYFQQAQHHLTNLSTDFSSELPILRERASTVRAALESKVSQIGEERLKIRNVLVILKDRSVAVRDVLNSCKEHLKSEAENLLEHKDKLRCDFQDFKNRILKDAVERDGLLRELEKAKVSITNLELAVSAHEKKQKEMETSLQGEIDRVRTLLTQRDVQLKELSRSERTLRKAKEELLSSSRQVITDGEENKKRMAALNSEKEKVVTERDDALKRLAEAEHALQQMSEKVAEALTAKQNALEALVREEGTAEQLRAKLANASELRSAVVEQQALPRAPPNIHEEQVHREIPGQTKDDIAEMEVESHKGQKENPRSSPGSKIASSFIQRGETGGTDPCEVDFAPKRAKRRMSGQTMRKNPRQKRARANGAKTATAAHGLSTQEPKPTAVSKESPAPQDHSPHKSAASAVERDQEWDIDAVIGKIEE